MICGCTQVDYSIPSSNEIALAFGDEIWTIDTNSENKRLLLKNGKILLCGGISWSPDGEKIIFVEWKKNYSELKMIDLVKKKIKKLLKKEGWIYDISWAPNGEKIIFMWQNEIYNFNINRGKLQKIVDNKIGGKYIKSPSLSPDGNNIVFQACYKSDSAKVYVMNINEKKVKRLSDNPPQTSERMPVWSPDGKWIAFEELGSKSKKPGFYIVLINPPTKQRYEIPLSKGMLIDNFNFSPDGKKIIFGTIYKGIYTIDIEGKNLKNLISPFSPYTVGVCLSWRKTPN